ncbi:hypothetical protein JTE90_024638 [Oedothorax gibbosus]|uniref:Uncharacterized protein n=1 Tax=Oedothorax gibbosus TaxID=931172 RepID=A0AAV6U383_9ARAC|nr:hypothetical protein JTE90_024638 [Oedothorax gibbosus]
MYFIKNSQGHLYHKLSPIREEKCEEIKAADIFECFISKKKRVLRNTQNQANATKICGDLFPLNEYSLPSSSDDQKLIKVLQELTLYTKYKKIKE